jgi:hypothetical protein
MHGFGERPAAGRMVDAKSGDAHGPTRPARHHDSTGVADALREIHSGGRDVNNLPAPPPERASGDVAGARERYAALAAQPVVSRGDQQRSVVGQLLRSHAPDVPTPRPQTRPASVHQAAEAASPNATRRRCQPRSRWADVGSRFLQARPHSADAGPVASTSRLSRGQNLMHQRPGRLGAEREWQRADSRPRGLTRPAAVGAHFGADQARLSASSARELNAMVAGMLRQARSTGGMGRAGDPGWVAWAGT